jgi:hypothetical protein
MKSKWPPKHLTKMITMLVPLPSVDPELALDLRSPCVGDTGSRSAAPLICRVPVTVSAGHHDPIC